MVVSEKYMPASIKSTVSDRSSRAVFSLKTVVVGRGILVFGASVSSFFADRYTFATNLLGGTSLSSQPRSTSATGSALLPLWQPFAWLLIVYLVAGLVSLQLRYHGTPTILIWLPDGLALAWLYRRGLLGWPGVALGAFLVNYLNWHSGLAAGFSSIGNVLALLVGVVWLKKLGFSHKLRRQTDVRIYVTACLLSAAVSSIFGVAGQLLSGVIPNDGLAHTWYTWYASTFVGLLLGGPVFFALEEGAAKGPLPQGNWPFAGLGLSAAALGVLFLVEPLRVEVSAVILLALLAVMVWLALKHGLFFSLTAVFLATSAAALGASSGLGTFGEVDSISGLNFLWGYLATLQIACLVFSAVKAEKDSDQAQVEASQAKIRQASGTLPNYSIIVLSPKGEIEYWNKGLRDLTGFSDTEVVGDSAALLNLEISHSPEQLQRFLAEAKDNGVAQQESWLHRKDGSKFFARVIAAPLTGESGELIGYSLVTQDITEKKLAQAAWESQLSASQLVGAASKVLLRETDEHMLFQRICQQVHQVGRFTMCWVGLTDTDAMKTVRPVAEFGEGTEFIRHAPITADRTSVYGNGPTGVAIRKKAAILVQDMLTEPQCFPWREGALATGLTACLSLPIVVRHEAVGALTVYKAQEPFTEVEVEALKDLTERLSECLEKIRTVQETLDKKSPVARPMLLANVSGELRTYMQEVLAESYSLKKEPGLSRASGAILNLERSVEKLRRLTVKLDELSKIEAGALELNKRPTRIPVMLGSALAGQQDLAKKHDVRLTVGQGVDEVSYDFLGDAVLLSKMTQSVISAAISFTTPGADVHVGASILEDNLKSVLLRLEVSYPPSERAPQRTEQAFDAFEREVLGTSAGILGEPAQLRDLLLVKHLAKLMGGRSGLKAEEGTNTLWFSVRLEKLPVGEETLFYDTEAAQLVSDTCAGKVVLVIDADEASTDYLQQLVHGTGIFMDRAAQLSEASIKVARQQYDIIFCAPQLSSGLDIGTDGAIKLIASLSKDTPLVALVPDATSRSTQAALREAGVADFVLKPVNDTDFYRAIHQNLKDEPLED